VEPEALEGVAALADGELEDGGAAGAEKDGAANFGDDGGGFAGLELVEGAGVLTVFVAEGQVVEEIFGGEDVLGFEELGDTGTDAADVHHFGVETSHRLDATCGRRVGANKRRQAVGGSCYCLTPTVLYSMIYSTEVELWHRRQKHEYL